MKNALNLIVKLFSLLTYLNFCPELFGHVGKRLDKKVSFTLTSKLGKKEIKIHILPNISKSKGNQTMKFGQLI